jgi:predicted transcriptional regulator
MLSLRLPAALARRLEKLARTTERNRSYVAVKAIEEYVESEEEILEKIREGLADAEAGGVVSHEEALAWVRELKAGRRPAARNRNRR